MQQFGGSQFSQTDVLMAYAQFDAWCINKNIMRAYDFKTADSFMLDRDPSGGSSEKKLNDLIGLDAVKKQIESILAADVVEKYRKKQKGSSYQSGAMHMIFAGSPGTAKSTVAGLFAGIAKEKGVLKSGAFVSVGGMEINTLPCLVRDLFTAAKGGVLFIDEAYVIRNPECIAVLIEEMENNRDNVIVILAGYDDAMHGFLQRNEGIKSRIPHWVDFPDYSADELTDIFKLMVKERGFTVSDDVRVEFYSQKTLFRASKRLRKFRTRKTAKNSKSCYN